MSPRGLELRRRGFRWLVPGAIVALAPKCGVCLAAYFGFGAAIGRAGAEFCGAPESEAMGVLAWLFAGGVVLAAGALAARACGLGPARLRPPTRDLAMRAWLRLRDRFNGCLPACEGSMPLDSQGHTVVTPGPRRGPGVGAARATA